MHQSLFDHHAFAARIGTDPEIQQELIELFIHSQPDRMTALARAVDTHDLVSARSLAHGLTGAFRSMSMDPLGDCAKQLEDAARHGDAAGSNKAMKQLSGLFATALDELHACSQVVSV